jgi:hypothetical protein
MEQLAIAGPLRDDAAALRARLAAEVPEPDRRDLARRAARRARDAGGRARRRAPAVSGARQRYLSIAPPRHADEEFGRPARDRRPAAGRARTADRLAELGRPFVVPPTGSSP